MTASKGTMLHMWKRFDNL